MNLEQLRQTILQLIEEDNYAEAFRQCSKLFTKAPHDSFVQEVGGFLFARITQGNYDFSPASAEEFKMRGVARFYHGEIEESIDDFDRALALDPQLHYAIKCKAFSLRELGRYEESIALLGQAIAIQPEGEYFDDIADVYSLMGEMENANVFHERAVKYAPEDARLWYNYGTHLGQLHEYAAAVEKFKRAIELWPEYPDAHHNLKYYEQMLRG